MAHKPVFTWEGGNVILFCPKAGRRSQRGVSLAGRGKLITLPSPRAVQAAKPAYATTARTCKVKSQSVR